MIFLFLIESIDSNFFNNREKSDCWFQKTPNNLFYPTVYI